MHQYLFPMNRFFVLLALISLSILTSCQPKRAARPMPESAQAYVLAYTQGIIFRTSSIRIQFAGNVVEETDIGSSPARNLVALSPAVAGNWTWEDRQTLAFTPTAMFDFSTSYLVTVQLGDLFDQVPEEAKVFEFAVNTRDPFVRIATEGLSTPDFAIREKQVLQGRLLTSDFVAADKASALLQATQQGRTLSLTWSHNDEGTVHYFTTGSINRGNEPSAVVLNWNGVAIGAQQKGQEKIEVPALGDFKVTAVTPINGGESRVDIHFSDPLDEQQDFSGLVSISNSDNEFRYLVAGHVLKVYPNTALSGEQKVSVFTGIRNRYQEKMPRTSLWDVTFTSVEPQVRLVGNGSILPTSTGLVFPFEAIGLQAVEVELFKIYNNNILQFLQNNSYDGNDEMAREGKVILRKSVQLNQLNPAANQQDWMRYALDLRQIFEADPKAIYQVRIGFQRSQSLYPCAVDRSYNFSNYDWQPENPDLLSSWYGIEGYYDNYSWEQRDDPCYPAYYNSDRFISRNVLASNLGIIVKSQQDKKYRIAVSDLRNTQPLAGVKVNFYNYQQQLLGTATTGSDGLAKIELPEKAFVLIAEASGDQGFLRLDDAEALSLSRFDVAGAETQEGLKGYIYGERGVWRPGDSVYLHFVLEDEQGLLPPAYPITFELRDARGQLVEKRVGVTPQGMIYPLWFKTQADSPTGIWEAKVITGGAHFQKTIRIETVKPNRIKIDLKFAETPLRLSGGSGEVKLTAAWLHGAPAANLKANVEASFSLRKDGFPRFKDYLFRDAENTQTANTAVVFDGDLDAAGEGTFAVKLPQATTAAGPLMMSLRSRVYESGGNFSTDNQSVEVHPFDFYAGLLLPTNRYGSPQITVGEKTVIELASANYAGEAAAGRTLKAELYRVEWRWWWDDDDVNGSRYSRDRNLSSLANVTRKTNAQGRASWDINVAEWGRYLLRVCDQSSGHCTSGYVYAGSPWYNEQEFSEEATMLTFSADKDSYQVGQQVKLTFPAGGKGRALLSLANGLGVLEERWLDTKAGDNTFTFKTTPAMSPTVYASLAVIQPHDQEQNDMPIRAYGVIPIGVEDPMTILKPVVNLPAEIKPEQSFTVEVQEATGQAMTYTIDIVDEGLLSLTRFKTPNPHDAFFAREALGVKTWDMYNFVLGKQAIQMDQILSIGGDGDLTGAKPAERANRFEPVVIHLGPFELGRKGRAKHTIKMPNYIGAVRAMVVAAAPRAYGSTEKTVPVRKPLMVLATLPRVLGIGESLELPVNVFAMKKGLGNVSIRLEETTGLVKLTNTRQQLNFTNIGDDLVSFPVAVGNATGIAKFRIVAEGGGERATQEIEIDVRNPNPRQMLVERFVLAPGQEGERTYSPFGSAGTRMGTLEMTNLPPIDLERRLDYLISYPYGCLEQTVTAGFPQLYLANFMQLTQKQENTAKANVAAALQRLRQFQTAKGGFAYWPNQTEVASWSTNYAGHFLLAAKARGYTLPAGLLENCLRFQKESARRWDPSLADLGHISKESYELDQAYRLYTLALAGQPELGAMNRLRERGQLSKASRWRLAAAYALAGQQAAAEQLINKVDTQVAAYRELGNTFGSALRDNAMILETLLLLKKQAAADQQVQFLSADLSSGAWLSTHEIAYSLLALSKYVGENEKLSSTYTFTLQQEGGKAIDAGADHPFMQINLADRSGFVRVKNTSKQKLFASIIRQGQPLPASEQATQNQLMLNVNYQDANGRSVDVTNLEQGTDFVALVTITHPGTVNYPYEQLALEQVFPAGWEITNTRFEGVAVSPQDDYAYRDFRDDRVCTFFNLNSSQTKTYVVYLTATYAGRFYLPAATCGAMYDNKISANTAGFWVEVSASVIN